MSGASDRANGRASGPVLESVFLAVIDHSVSLFSSSQKDEKMRHDKEGEEVENMTRERRERGEEGEEVEKKREREERKEEEKEVQDYSTGS